MRQLALSPSFKLICVIALLLPLLTVFASPLFPLLDLDRSQVANGEFWRILTSSFVHFGWTHTLMNLAAFVLCSLALFNSISLERFLLILVFCCIAVGLGIYVFNPEYQIYAGLSGAIHGLIVAGLMINRRHVYWINGFFIALVFVKIFYEQQPGYRENELQQLLPVAVAYDAHLYGAVAGFAAGLACVLYDYIKASNSPHIKD